MAGIDRRKQIRFPLQFPTLMQIADRNNGVISLVTENICSGGAYFPTNKPMPFGAKVTANLEISIQRQIAHIIVAGAVIRIEKRRHGCLLR